MKGIVFSEFIEMVEDAFSPEVADQIIMDADLESGGAYTAVGTYDHSEIVQLVVNLSEATDVPVPDLLNVFGRHLFERFLVLYPTLTEGFTSSFDFLQHLEDHIHSEVRKLYPDADLPHFTFDQGPDRLVLEYRSQRGFADLAHGLIEGCIKHYGEAIELSRESLDGAKEVRFGLQRQGGAVADRGPVQVTGSLAQRTEQQTGQGRPVGVPRNR